MQSISVTAALIISVIAGILTTSAFLLPESVARESLEPVLLFAPSEPCANEGPQLYVDTLGEPVSIGCAPTRLEPLDLQAPAFEP